MKKLLFLSLLVLFSCSKENEVEEELDEQILVKILLTGSPVVILTSHIMEEKKQKPYMMFPMVIQLLSMQNQQRLLHM